MDWDAVVDGKDGRRTVPGKAHLPAYAGLRGRTFRWVLLAAVGEHALLIAQKLPMASYS
jgi:hypothetical protein